MLSQCSYLLYFGDIPNLVSCAFSTIPIFPPFNSQNFLFTCLCSFFYLIHQILVLFTWHFSFLGQKRMSYNIATQYAVVIWVYIHYIAYSACVITTVHQNNFRWRVNKEYSNYNIHVHQIKIELGASKENGVVFRCQWPTDFTLEETQTNIHDSISPSSA